MKKIKIIISLVFVIQLISVIVYFPAQKWVWEGLVFEDVWFITNLVLWGILFEKHIKKYNLSFRILTIINNKKGGSQ